MLATIANVLFIIVLVLYLSKIWNEAKAKRDIHDALRAVNGSQINKKKSSVFPFLFK
jgi:hypothetical protein